MSYSVATDEMFKDIQFEGLSPFWAGIIFGIFGVVGLYASFKMLITMDDDQTSIKNDQL